MGQAMRHTPYSLARGRRSLRLALLFPLIVLLAWAGPLQSPPAQAATGLVAGYAFSEGTGATTADASGNGITGTLTSGPAWVAGRNGTGLSFNGSNTYVDLGNPTALQLTGSMTLSAWVYETANVGDDGQIIAKSDGSSGWQLKSSPDTGVRTFAIGISDSNGAPIQRYSNTIRALNTWYHVTGVYDASARTLSIYVNGVLDNGVLSGTVPATQRLSSVNANIGRRTGGFHIQGTIDDVRVYGRALQLVEIQADMNTPVGGGTPPSFDFSLSNGGNKSVVQGAAVTNGVNATLVSGATQPVAFAASGLPAGATAAFSPTSCSPVCATTLTLTTGASTPIGTSTITVTGTWTSLSRTTTFSLSVTSAADTTPPTVSLTAPAPGATVSGTAVTVSATASDNVGVSGVQFLLDGANLGGEDTTSPYSVTWNTTTTTSGPHVIAARARDAAGNSTVSTNINVIVDNQAATGLVAGYAFSEGTGATTADASGNGITGTLVSGPAWVAGRNGTGLSFNGSNTYVDLGNPAALQLTGSMTFSAWVYETANVGDDGQIVAKSDGGSGWQLKSSPDTGVRTFAIAITDSSGAPIQRYSNTVRALNTWYHVTGVYDASARTLSIYVNGVLDNGVLSGTVPASQRLSSVNANIGRRTGGFNIRGRSTTSGSTLAPSRSRRSRPT